jgi:hypothetical protein
MGQAPGKVFDFFALIASIDQTLKSYYNSVAITSSQFLRGVEFGKGEKDSLYLMAVKTIELTLNPTALTYGKAEGPKTLAIFMNREVTGEDHPPFNVQIGEYAGLLMRRDKDAENSVTCYRDSYLQKVTFFQEMLAKDYKDKKVGEYLVDLAKRHSGRIALLDKFANANFNKKFIESLESKNVCDVMDKKVNGGEFTGGHAEMLCMIINLLRYVDAFFVTCPACEHIVSLSWGWCPYHGTMEELKLKDVNGDGKFDDGFKKYLKDNSFDKKYFLDAYEEEIANEKPLFVHWTQFRVSRGRG